MTSHPTADAVEYVRVSGACMAPRIPDGAWVAVDPARAPRAGDYVVVKDNGGDVRVKELAEWAGKRWLVTLSGLAPIELNGHLELVGVVSCVLQMH
jgi:phage repressor protein C with HTH and peptisase S24 domain